MIMKQNVNNDVSEHRPIEYIPPSLLVAALFENGTDPLQLYWYANTGK